MSTQIEVKKRVKRLCSECNHANNKLFDYRTEIEDFKTPRKRFICNRCRKRFNRVSNTAVSYLKTDISDIAKALMGVAKGLSVRDAAELFNFKPETIQRWLHRAGIQAEYVMDTFFKDLDPGIIQLDEMWTYVYKRKNSSTDKITNRTSGTIWVWVAFIVEPRLIVAVYVGKRTQKDADIFIDKIFKRINPIDAFWTTDKLKQYKKALLKKYAMMGYSPDTNNSTTLYGRVVKVRKNGRMLGVSTEAVWGEMEQIEKTLRKYKQRVINTSFVERVNLTIRQEMSKLHRKQLTFAKTLQGLRLHISFYAAYYNFCRFHMSLKEEIPEEKRDSTKKWNKNTPTMAANLTDHRWSVEELLLFQSGLNYDPLPMESVETSVFRPTFRKPLPIYENSGKKAVQELVDPTSVQFSKNDDNEDEELPFILTSLVDKQIEQYLICPTSKFVCLRYTDRKGVTKERTIEYDGFYYEVNHLYITGYCHLSKGHRTFRMDRIQSFNPLINSDEAKLLLPESVPRKIVNMKPRKRRTFPSNVERKVIFLPKTSSNEGGEIVLAQTREDQERSKNEPNSPKPIFLKGNPEAFLNLLGDQIALLIWQFLFWCYPDPQNWSEMCEGTGYDISTCKDAIDCLLAYRMIELCTDPDYLIDKDPEYRYYIPIGSVLDNYLEPP